MFWAFRHSTKLVVAFALLFAAEMSLAAGLPAPAGVPILTVGGKISRTNDGAFARFDRQMLQGLGTATIRTKTPWYDEVVEFEGVPMDRLMEEIGASGTEVTVTALNDYQTTIPLEDFERFGVILAMKRDGKDMPIRDKGPLFIVYPYDSDPELQTQQYYGRSAWQVKDMQVR